MRVFPNQSGAVRGGRRAFTLVEIAICLGIIGIALVAIIGILPAGLHTQQDSRQETVVSQDASMLFEAVRNGTHGADDLTNYVYLITNTVTLFGANSNVIRTDIYGYTYNGSTFNGTAGNFGITNGGLIVGLLSTPQFWTNDPANFAHKIYLPNVYAGGYSNHLVVYVRSMSGLISDKPPQNNDILISDAFAYRVYVVNAPMNLQIPAAWNPGTAYASNSLVYTYWNYGRWLSTNSTAAGDQPGVAPVWTRYNPYSDNLALNLREFRMTFYWPILPNGNVGKGRQTFRELIPGQVQQTNGLYDSIYFYNQRNFTNTPSR